MRIVIDARFYGPYGKGLGRYTQKLIEWLERVDTDNTYIVLLRKENWDAYQPVHPRWSKQLADFQWYSLDEQVKLPKLLRHLHPDIVHFPHFNVPLFYRGKFVVTIHDLILTHFPTRRATTLGPLVYALKHFAYSVVIRRAIARAKKVITVSEFSRNDLISTFHLDPSRVRVTLEGVDRVEKKHDEAASQHMSTVFHLDHPYLLYVGNAYPHKNIERLLEAFSIMAKKNFEIRLVIVGREDYFQKRIRTRADDLGIRDRVIFPGFVNDIELRLLYSSARAFVFPSLYEGFGLPPLEAMAAGVPVVASRVTSIPEVLGD
ncbi:MAG: glycosyltransferase family 1 protein, partial [Patescibacteria group bacterium]